MSRDRDALALELKQIIQADRMAVDIIQNALDVRKSIEKQTEKEKVGIREDAEKKRQEMEKQVEAEMAELLEARRAEMEKSFQEQRKYIRDTLADNHSRWVEQITDQIINTGQA